MDMDKTMKSGIIKTFALLVYLIVCVIATAGAIQHGFDAHEHIFTFAGVANLAFAVWTLLKVWNGKKEEQV